MKLLIHLFVLTAIIIFAGCSSHPGLMTPDLTPGQVLDSISQNQTEIMGAWHLSFNWENNSVDLTPKRMVSIGESYIVNGTGFFTRTPCADCLEIDSLGLTPEGNLAVYFSISHPFDKGNPANPPTAINRLDLDVFDLALVFVPEGMLFELFDLHLADIAMGMCPDADGYTTELNSKLFTISAYPYFLVIDDSDTGVSTNNKFEMGSKDVVFDTYFSPGTHEVDLYLTMGYGASAAKAQRLTPSYYLPEFNRKASWKVNVVMPSTPWDSLDGVTTQDVIVEVFDWQVDATVNPDMVNLTDVYAGSNIDGVSLELRGLISAMMSTSTPTGTHTGLPDDPMIYTFAIANENMVPPGSYKGLVKVSDQREPVHYAVEGDIDSLVNTEDGIAITWHGIDEFATYQVFEALVE